MSNMPRACSPKGTPLLRDLWAAASYPVRYLIVAGACLVLHNCILIAANWSGLTLWQAAALSFCILLLVGYAMLTTFVFNVGFSWPAFGRYFTAMAANFPLSSGLLWLFFEVARQPMSVAAPAASVAMVALNLVISRWAIIGRFQRPQSNHR